MAQLIRGLPSCASRGPEFRLQVHTSQLITAYSFMCELVCYQLSHQSHLRGESLNNENASIRLGSSQGSRAFS